MLLLLLLAIRAGAGPQDGDVQLTLENAAGAGRPMVLELELKGDQWGSRAWGQARRYNWGRHNGTVSAAKDRLVVELAVEPDVVAPGGKARYEISLTRRDDVFSGRYTGVFLDGAVTGDVSGTVSVPVVRPVPGFRELKAGEHPRLVFRKTDLPELKRRAATPEGAAILSMLTTRSPLRYPSQVSDRRASWMAANWGAIYQLTGDRTAADQARTILMSDTINKPMPLDRKDIHHATRLLGVALTYDFCHDAWDESFRRLMVEYIGITMNDLRRGVHDGRPMAAGTLDPDPRKHRNAIRMACIGCAALAIAKDPDSEGKTNPDADRFIAIAERDLVTYLQEGITASGAGCEGGVYKSIALSNGVLQFLQALRTAAGRDLSRVNPHLLTSHVVGARLGRANGARFGISSISVQAAGRWPMGLGSIPREYLPAMKWCYDRACGLEGAQHFDCAYPYHAAYALQNYPFGVSAVPPAEQLPMRLSDERCGHVVFRNGWKDDSDMLVTIDLNGRPLKAGTREDPPTGWIRIDGAGQTWLDGMVGIRPLNWALGPEVMYVDTTQSDQLFVGAKLDRLYLQRGRSKRRSRRPQPAATATEIEGFEGSFGDLGIRCERHIAVDYSGDCGVPALVVIVDRLTKTGNFQWDFKALGEPAGSGSSFTVGDPAGVNLAGRFVAPSGRIDYRGCRAGAGEGVFLVLTIQGGPAPQVTVKGQGLDAAVRVGNRTVSFDGTRIILGK